MIGSVAQNQYLPEKALLLLFAQEYYKIYIRTHQATLEELYWYINLQRYLSPESIPQNQEFFSYVMDCEVETDEVIGFIDNPLTQAAKNNPKIKNPNPNIIATSLGLAIIKYIGRFNDYIERRSSGITRNKIFALINSLIKDGKFRHCQNAKCERCKEEPPESTLFHGLMIYDLFGTPPSTYQNILYRYLQNTESNYRNIFRLLCLRYMGIKEGIKDEEIYQIYKHQKPNGGFTFQNSAIPTINETFWITQTLEAYRWLLPYPPGPIFSYLVQQLKPLDVNPSAITKSKVIDVGQLTSLAGMIWETLIDEIENLMFPHLSDTKIMDLNVLSVEGGILGAEQEVINFINSRYNFILEIKDNQTLFRRYLNSRLDQFQQNFAKLLLTRVETYAQFEISTIRSEFNRGKKKQNRITDEFLIHLLEEMMKEFFFKGRIISKRKILFGKAYYYLRDAYIDRVLLCDRPLAKDEIIREKRRLKEVMNDIYNMTEEMKSATENIMNEVESLIIAEELTLAEERTKINIKKALFDASFFHKTIQSFQEEFVYLKVDQLLNPQIQSWESVYNTLQSRFSDTKRILIEKINEIRQDQEQRQIALTLEQLVQKKINEISDRFDTYQETLRTTLEGEYTRSVVEELILNFQKIDTFLNSADQEIKQQTNKIVIEKGDIVKIRKKAIDEWISQYKEFEQTITYYRTGFDIWKQKINQLDVTHQNFVKEIEITGKKITEASDHKQYEKALQMTDDFQRILSEIEKVAKSLKKELDDIIKSYRKMYPLLKNIQTEWMLYQNVLEQLTHQMRTEFKTNLQTDLNWALKEDFRLLIDKSVINLREELVHFQKRMSSLIRRDEDIPDDAFTNNYKDLMDLLHKKDKDIMELKKRGSQQSDEFKQEADKVLPSWNIFKEQYQKSLKELQDRYEDEQIIHRILQYAQKTNSNFLDITPLANHVKLKESELVDKIKAFILTGRINANYVPKANQIEIHNDDWRKWMRLKQFIEVPLREIALHTSRIINLVEKSIASNIFSKNMAQFESLTALFEKKIQDTLALYNSYIQREQINLDNSLVKLEDKAFRDQIQQYQQQITMLHTRAEKAIQFQQYLEDKIKEFEILIHSEIHRINSGLQSRNLQKYSKNLKWFEIQKQEIITTMEEKNKEIVVEKEKAAKEFEDLPTLISELYGRFEQKKVAVMENLELQMSDLLEKISSNELTHMKAQLETIIQEKQTELNRMLSLLDRDIKVHIGLKEYGVAARDLTARINQIEKVLKNIEKELKIQNKAFESKSKIFGIKHRYIIEQWELFLLEYLNSLHEKQVELEEIIIEFYLKFAAKALKGSIVPYKMVSDDLSMKKEYIQTRLMSLIGEGKLTGKININLEIYYEGEEEIDPQTVSQLEILSSTNVKTYLRLQRILNFARIIAPVLTIVASSFTVAYNLRNITNDISWIPIALVIVGALMITTWLIKGRQKAVKSGLTSLSQHTP